MKTRGLGLTLLFCSALFLLTGCAGSSSYMKEVPSTTIDVAPGKNEASVIFMRPSGMAFAISSSVFDVEGDENNFAGIVSAKKKIVYKAKPGHHLFMVIGESADFMEADLKAGKVYYALVTPRIGAWKARFSLKPMSRNELHSQEFKDWSDSCAFTENTDASLAWAKENSASIEAKKKEYLPKWQEKSAEDKPVLKADDHLF